MGTFFSKGKFRKINLLTIITLFVLILAGGIVRSSGSGMGCPDWPRCFNKWVPPTQASELPAGYQEIYVRKRLQKNERAAKIFAAIGLGDIAYKIQHDSSVFKAEGFNALKTYTEYI